MTQVHAVVWLDHREARVISFSLGTAGTSVEVHSENARPHIHRKAGQVGSGHAADDHQFFDQVAQSLDEIPDVLITGPGNAKTAFVTYIATRHPGLARRVVGVETLDHPTQGELLAHARKSFAAIDQLGRHQ